MDLYREEKQQALKDGVLSKVFLALSREKNVGKVIITLIKLNIRYIQDNGVSILVSFRCTFKT